MAERRHAMSISSKQISPAGKTKRKRRKRTIITKNVLEKLEAVFALDQWPNRDKKEKLALEIDKSESFINNWFQNRRARMKKSTTMCKDILADSVKEKSSMNPQDPKFTFHEIKFNLELVEGQTEKNAEKKVITDKQIPKTRTSARVMCREADKIEAEKENINSNENKVVTTPGTSSLDANSWGMIFKRIVGMAAASEGVLRRTHPTFNGAMTDAALGIRLIDGKLIYNKEYGLDVTDHSKSATS